MITIMNLSDNLLAQQYILFQYITFKNMYA